MADMTSWVNAHLPERRSTVSVTVRDPAHRPARA